MISLKHKDNDGITEKSTIFESNERTYFNFDFLKETLEVYCFNLNHFAKIFSKLKYHL